MRAAVAVAILLAACGRSEPRARREAVPPVSVAVPLADAATAPDSASVIPAVTKQLVTAIVSDWDSTTAELQLWTREGSTWRAAGPSWPGVVGRTGTAWGTGLHGTGAPAGRAGPVKREGDGKSPAGVFALTTAYGYAAQPPTGAGLRYVQTDPSYKCVDDPASRHYNQILKARTREMIDWNSAEEMKRSDDLYTWVVEIAHNAARKPGAGSCIFLHVWGGPDSTTVGCTAMDERKLAALIATLSTAAQPVLVVLPRAEYDSLAVAWSLPR